MRKLLIVSVLVMALMAACAPAAAPATEAPVSAVAESASSAPVAESAASSATASADSSSAALASGEEIVVNVQLGDNWILSDVTTFKVGQAYRFIITNVGNRTHNFHSTPVGTHSMDNAIAMQSQALLSVPNEKLGPGMQAEATFTFTEAAPEGTLEFSCLVPRHYQSGQVLPIVVEP